MTVLVQAALGILIALLALAEPGVVDVGGQRLYLECTGSGSPTVSLEADLFGSSRDWAAVQRGS
jgi:hypothetical protein